MKIGCPSEIKPQEFRVGMTPNAAREAIAHGHSVLIQTGAGVGAGFADEDYITAGAEIAVTPPTYFAKADMIVKVKEPQAGERKMLREGQLLFTYLHLAPDPEQTKDLLASGARPSPMKPSQIVMVACLCLRRCPKLQAVWPPSWRMDLAKGKRWSRRLDGRRSRCWACSGRCHWRRRCGHTCRTDRSWHGRGCDCT